MKKSNGLIAPFHGMENSKSKTKVTSSSSNPDSHKLQQDHEISNGLEVLDNTGIFYIVPYKKCDRPWPEVFKPYLEREKRFTVENKLGRRLFYILEPQWRDEYSCFPRSYRPFLLHFYDPWGRLVIEVERKWTAALCFWGAEIWGNSITVILKTTEEVIGKVFQNFSCCKKDGTSFRIRDVPGVSQSLIIEGHVQRHCCTWPPPDYVDINLQIVDKHAKEAVAQSFFMKDSSYPEDSDYGLDVPSDMSCHLKTVLLGFLLDIYITYYENGRVEKEPEYGKFHYSYPGRRGCTGWKACYITMFVVFLIALIIGTVLFILFEEVIVGYLRGDVPMNGY